MADDRPSHAGIERALGNVQGTLQALKEQVTTSQDKASRDRGRMFDKLEEIDSKVDPLVQDVETLKLQVKAHDIALISYEKHRNELLGAARFGRWLVHLGWMAIGTIVLLWSDYIRFPLSKIFSLWNGRVH